MTNTEDLIVNSFLTLIQEKTPQSVTVREITDLCHINRNTFYYHFNSISGLIGHMLCRQLDAVLFEDPTPKKPEDYLPSIAQALLKDKKTVLHIYRALSRDTLMREFPKAAQHAVHQYLVITDRADSPDSDVLAQFYSASLTGFLLTWLEGGLTPELENSARKTALMLKKA
ncbi:MAG: TetR/AcrR family transcriptional regulator [Lachnospiraceae bacterium]|nr:TetR/AcrR family transcriptional regulator [Lachnospiraceae bacterium]